MKKSLLALAALTAFAGAASAQSSVTLFGILDAAYAHVSVASAAGLASRSNSGITNSGINSSRLGFRGVEDLGGGLKAAFWLEGQLNNDIGTGANGSAAGGYDFRRRTTVALLGNFGELRVGRDYTPNFWSTTAYDPFGTNGVAQSNALSLFGTAGAGTYAGGTPNTVNAVRGDNTVAYFLPTLGGLEGWFQYRFGESNTNADPGKKANNQIALRVGYATGPISAHVAYAKTEGLTDAADLKYTNVAASYDFGIVKPMVVWVQEKAGSGAKISAWELGLVAPIGQSELRFAYSKYDINNSNNDWNKLGLGYVYNLSKRSALYAQYARVSNKGVQNVSVSNNGLSAGAANPGGSSTGYEFGIRHQF
jgi:predicted porin